MPVERSIASGDRGARVTPYTRCQGRLRMRPNHELEYLRQLVVDLEEELAVLRQPDEETTQGLELSAGETWECIASRLSKEINAALMENLKLRTMQEGQTRLARALEAAIDQHVTKVCRQTLWSSPEMGHPRATDLSDELLYALLDERLEEHYARAGEILGSTKPTRVNDKVNSTVQVEHDSRGMSFSYNDTRVLPFSVESVLRATQNCLSHGSAGRPMGRCRKLMKTGNYLQATTVDKLQLPNRVKVTSRLIQRYFSEANRVVLVWASYVEIDGSVLVRLEEKGWASIEPYEFNKRGAGGPSKSNSVPGSSLQSVIHVTPIATDFSSDEEEKRHVEEMKDLVVGTYHRNIGLLSQVLENLLMDGLTS